MAVSEKKSENIRQRPLMFRALIREEKHSDDYSFFQFSLFFWYALAAQETRTERLQLGAGQHGG